MYENQLQIKFLSTQNIPWSTLLSTDLTLNEFCTEVGMTMIFIVSSNQTHLVKGLIRKLNYIIHCIVEALLYMTVYITFPRPTISMKLHQKILQITSASYIWTPTPCCHHCLHHEVRYVRIEDLDDEEIGIEPLDAHPGDSGQDKEVDESCNQPTGSRGHPRAASLGRDGVEQEHQKKRHIETHKACT